MINKPMAKPEKRVLGVYAPPPRPTLWAAFLLAVTLAVPTASALWLVDWIW